MGCSGLEHRSGSGLAGHAPERGGGGGGCRRRHREKVPPPRRQTAQSTGGGEKSCPALLLGWERGQVGRKGERQPAPGDPEEAHRQTDPTGEPGVEGAARAGLRTPQRLRALTCPAAGVFPPKRPQQSGNCCGRCQRLPASRTLRLSLCCRHRGARTNLSSPTRALSHAPPPLPCHWSPRGVSGSATCRRAHIPAKARSGGSRILFFFSSPIP